MHKDESNRLLRMVDDCAEVIREALIDREEITTDSQYNDIFSEIIGLAESIISERTWVDDYTTYEAMGHFQYLSIFRRRYCNADDIEKPSVYLKTLTTPNLTESEV